MFHRNEGINSLRMLRRNSARILATCRIELRRFISFVSHTLVVSLKMLLMCVKDASYFVPTGVHLLFFTVYGLGKYLVVCLNFVGIRRRHLTFSLSCNK